MKGRKRKMEKHRSRWELLQLLIITLLPVAALSSSSSSGSQVRGRKRRLSRHHHHGRRHLFEQQQHQDPNIFDRRHTIPPAEDEVPYPGDVFPALNGAVGSGKARSKALEFGGGAGVKATKKGGSIYGKAGNSKAEGGTGKASFGGPIIPREDDDYVGPVNHVTCKKARLKRSRRSFVEPKRISKLHQSVPSLSPPNTNRELADYDCDHGGKGQNPPHYHPPNVPPHHHPPSQRPPPIIIIYPQPSAPTRRPNPPPVYVIPPPTPRPNPPPPVYVIPPPTPRPTILPPVPIIFQPTPPPIPIIPTRRPTIQPPTPTIITTPSVLNPPTESDANVGGSGGGPSEPLTPPPTFSAFTRLPTQSPVIFRTGAPTHSPAPTITAKPTRTPQPTVTANPTPILSNIDRPIITPQPPMPSGIATASPTRATNPPTTTAPSAFPTTRLQRLGVDCAAIADGTATTDAPVRSFNVDMDLTIFDETEFAEVVRVLREILQTRVAPRVAGCPPVVAIGAGAGSRWLQEQTDDNTNIVNVLFSETEQPEEGKPAW